MSKQSKTISPQTVVDAEAIAKATQQPGQTKEQTKLIAKGIQKGIAEYKKRQKSKARELDKKLRKVKSSQVNSEVEVEPSEPSAPASRSKLPWVLLAITWLLIIAAFLSGYVKI